MTNASITRAQIASYPSLPSLFTVSGFTTPGDLGAGAQYTSQGATSGGPLAIQGSDGTWYNLVINGPIPIGQLGAITGIGNVAANTAAFQAAAVLYAAGYSIVMPAGSFYISSSINISQTTVNAGQSWTGAGQSSTIIYPTSGIDVFIITGSVWFIGELGKFSIQSSYSTGRGIAAYNMGVYLIYNSKWHDMYISTGGDGIYIEAEFDFVLERVNCTSLNGHACALKGGNCTRLIDCFNTLGQAGTLRAAYRIGGEATLIQCSGMGAAGSGDYWGVFGCRANTTTATAQTGSSNTITLAASSGFCTDGIKAFNIVINGGTGSGQTALCTAYNSSTKVATISGTWTTPPDSSSTYSIQDPEVGFQGTAYPQIHMIDCDVEDWSVDGVRTIQYARSFVIENPAGQFNSMGGGYSFHSFIHLYGGLGTSYTHTFNNLSLYANGATRTGQADIICDFTPPVIIGYNAYDSLGNQSCYCVQTSAVIPFSGTFLGTVVEGVDAAVTAIGTTAANSYALVKQWTQVTTAASTAVGVTLPAATAGELCRVSYASGTAASIKVWPTGTDQIDAGGAGTNQVITKLKTIDFICFVAGLWESHALGAATS